MQMAKTLVRQLTDVLEAEAIPYMYGGALALRAHGLVSSEPDIELVMDLPLDRAEVFSKQMADLGILLRERYEGPERELHFSGQQLDSGLRVTISLVRPGDSRLNAALSRRQSRAPGVGWGMVWVYSLEDLLLEKLRQYALSERDPVTASQAATLLASVKELNRAWVAEKVVEYGLEAAWTAIQIGSQGSAGKTNRPNRV